MAKTHTLKISPELEGSPCWAHGGIMFAGISEDEARLEILVSRALLKPNGSPHGGAIASLPDAAIGEATGEAPREPA